MAPSERVLTLKITGDASGLGRAFGQVGRGASRMDRGMDRARRGMVNMGKAAGLAAAAVATAGAAFAKLGLDGAIAQEKLNARTQNVLRTMGQGAGRTTEQIEGLATSIERATGSDGQVVQAGANLVLTFANIKNAAGAGNDVFDQTVKLANDMSVALGTGMEQSSMQLGKALNDPIRGLTQLRRVGVSFTDQQQDQVKAMVASGDTMGAQKIILSELEKQFGGAAASEGPLTEAMQSLTNTFGEVSEAIMVKALPALTSAVEVIRTNVVPVIQDMAERIAPLIGQAMEWVGQKIGEAAAWIRRNWDDIRTVLMDVWAQIEAAVVPVVRQLVAAVTDNWDRIRKATSEVFDEVVITIRSVMQALRPVLAALAALVRSTLELVLTIWEQWGDDIFRIVRRVFGVIAQIVRPLLDTLRSIIETVTAAIEGDWSRAWEGIKGILRNALRALVAAIRGVGGLILSAMRFIAGRILEGLKAVPGRMLQAGKDIVDKIIEGIKAAPGKIKDAIIALIPTPADLVSELFGGNRTTSRSLAPGSGGLGSLAGRANGGMLPGTYQGRDTMLIAAAPGEAVLTPRQQSLVDSGVPIRTAFAMTGGRMGGSSFRHGGHIEAALGFAAATAGKSYTPGGVGQGERLGPNHYDCSGWAGIAAIEAGASITRGGWTGSYVGSGQSSPSRGNEQVIWGFDNPQQMRGHMGIKLGPAGWYDFGGGGLKRGRSSWQIYRVPRGLEGWTEMEGEDTPGTNTEGGDTGSGTEAPLTDRQKLADLLGKATGRAGLGTGAGKPVSKWAKPLVNTLTTDVPDVSGSSTGTNYTGAQGRTISGAARKARTAARRDGKSPEEVREAGEAAEREAELKVLRINRREVIQKRAALRKAKHRLLTNWRKLTRKPARTPKARAARKKATREINAKLREYTAEINDLTEIIAEIAERMREIGEEVIEAAHEANYEAGEEAARAAEEAARAAEAGEAPGSVGAGAEAPAAEPATPLDYLNLAATLASTTEGTDDDLAVLSALLQYRQGELAQAIPTGDPRLINTALQNLLTVQQQIRALMANTEALTENTQAMQGLTGSVTFGFRGQDYVLRNLAPPSSDRIENILVGA